MERPDFAQSEKPEATTEADKEIRRKTHQTIQKVTVDMTEGFKFNTAISAMMEMINLLYDYKEQPGAKTPLLREALEALVKLLGPFTPHVADEMWSRLGDGKNLLQAGWPQFDPALLKSDVVEIPVQVNGKVKTRVNIAVGLAEETVRDFLLKEEKVLKFVRPETVQKLIWVKDKLANFIVRTN